MTFAPLTGLIAAPFTAFQEDGSLHLAQIERQAASLIANGVSGAFICGSTGEGASMSTAERMQVAERWVQAAGRDVRVMVHVGHTALADCKALAAQAQEIGATGVGCLAPFYFKAPDVEALTDFCAEVAAAAPALPFYYYHIPSMTGAPWSAAAFLRVAAPRIPNLAGVKFTHENLMDFAECIRLDAGRYDIVFGRDEMLVAGWALGGRGAIGSTYNCAAPVFHELLAACARGDLAAAQERQAAANAIIGTMLRHGGLAAGKAMMKFIGLDCGPVRPPLRPLDTAREAALRADLERVRFFDLCSR